MNASSILIAFCNPEMSDNVVHVGGLMKYHLETGTLERIDIVGDVNPMQDTLKKARRWLKQFRGEQHGTAKPWLSSLGLVASDRYIFHAFATISGTYIVTLNRRTLRPVQLLRTVAVVAVHSVAVAGSDVYVVSTGTDEVIHYRCDESGRLSHVGVLWRASETGADVHHINAVTVDPNGDILCSAFGPRTGETWLTARDGYIYNISRQQKLDIHVLHPHTVMFHGTDMYYIESGNHRLMCNGQTLFEFEGFMRGLCFPRDDLAVIGLSTIRARSKSTGKPGELAKKEGLTNACGLIFLNLNTHDYEFVNLDTVNNEIYDLMPLYD